MKYPFNVRVYGALIVGNKILLSTESYQHITFTKLPGGGLEFGEGLRQCLKREFIEELALPIIVEEHIYTTDFFQQSAFNENEQVLSIYFRVSPADKNINVENLTAQEKGNKIFWKDLNALSESDFTFPIDKYVAGILRNLEIQNRNY